MHSSSAPLPRSASLPAPVPAPAEGSQTSPKPARRITQLDIARVAGVHNTTVSLALRNSSEIPAETRKRILAIAGQLGYQPDPALRALVAYRRSTAVNRRIETIAYVTNGATRFGWRGVAAQEDYFLGAQQKAATCGYQLEHFWLGEPGMTQRRLSNMLLTRGISGALLAMQRGQSAELLEIDWDQLSAIALGNAPEYPPLHRVTDDPMGSARQVVRRVAAAGYRRVGLVLSRDWDEAHDESWSLGFASEQRLTRSMDRVPVLSLHDGEKGARVTSENEFEQWWTAYRPEVVIGLASFVMPLLSRLELSVPGDVAFVDLSPREGNSVYAGIRQNHRRAGEVAVDLLVGQLQQNLRGLPSVSTTTLVEGVWSSGASLPCRAKSPTEFEIAEVESETSCAATLA